MANAFFFYIDDGRPTAISGKKCLHALRSIGSILIFGGFKRLTENDNTNQVSGEYDETSVNSSNWNTIVLVSCKSGKRGRT